MRDLTGKCNYSIFVNYLAVFVLAGLSVELLPVPPSKAKPAGGGGGNNGDAGSGSDSKAAPASVGHICFNPAQASENVPKPECGTLTYAPDSTKKSDPVRIVSPAFGEVEVEFGFRSPIGAFNHFGDLLRQPLDNVPNYHTLESSRLMQPGEPYLNVTQGASAPCFSAVSYGGSVYCVPPASMHTAMLFDILIQLRNMSIQATDLNSAFTVRLTN